MTTTTTNGNTDDRLDARLAVDAGRKALHAYVVHTGQPHPTLTEAMASLAAAASGIGYTIESITLTKGPAQIKLVTTGIELTADAADAIVRRAKEAKDRGGPLT